MPTRNSGWHFLCIITKTLKPMLHIPTIAIFHSNIRKLSELFDNYEFPESYTGRILYSNNPDAIGPLIAREQPSVIITCADSTQYDDTINALNYQINLIWHQEENLETVYSNLLHYAELATSHDCLVSRNPRFSICTPTHNTPRHAVLRLYNSLKMQTYRDWEWVIYDTSTNYETIGELLNIASNDPRVKITFNRFEPKTGNIGFVKNQVFMLATGDYALQTMVMRKIENGLRDFLNFDILSIRTMVVQNALKYSISRQSERQGINISNFFDNTTVYIGKYFSKALYADAMLRLSYNKNRINDATTLQGLIFKPEIGFELESPLAKIRWSVAPDLSDLSQSRIMIIPSLTLSWKFNF